jgi:hypothetical protein
MRDRLAALYPPEFQDYPIIERVSVPGFPGMHAPHFPAFKDPWPMYGDRLLYEFIVSDGAGGDRLVLVNKLYPHGLHDMMVLSLDDPPKPSIAGLGVPATAVVLGLAERFLEYVGDPEVIKRFHLDEGCFHFCYNYDPDTLDRESGMADKRFHLHLNYWSREIDKLSPRPFGSLSNLSWRRRLIDPITSLGEQIAYDLLSGAIGDIPLLPPNPKRDLCLGLPPGLKIRFDGWSVLRDPVTVETLRNLHTELSSAHALIVRAFTNDDRPPGRWRRHSLLPASTIRSNVAAISGLSEASKQGLVVLAEALQDVSSLAMEAFRNKKWLRIQHLAMAGLNYSLGLYAQQTNRIGDPLLKNGPVYLVVQTKLFADIGGAGIPYMKALPIVRIQRGDGVFNSRQIRNRDDFQAGFVAYADAWLSGRPEVAEVRSELSGRDQL